MHGWGRDEKVYDCILFDAIPGYRGTWMIKYTRVYFLMPRRGAWMIKYTRVYFFVKISKQWPITMDILCGQPGDCEITRKGI
jgi:hypothetical protein